MKLTMLRSVKLFDHVPREVLSPYPEHIKTVEAEFGIGQRTCCAPRVNHRPTARARSK
jgi:hypothetical protein